MDFLFQMVNYEKVTKFKYDSSTFNLSRVEQLMDAVGGPHRRLHAVHIAGTKGKGSVAHMVHVVLSGAGLTTGLYTQPHLVDLEERIRINGEPIAKEETVALLQSMYPYVQRIRAEAPEESPTFFDLVTTAAFASFAQHKVDVAVIEVGLGGRLDSTNVIQPQVAVITRIDYDHVNRLGPTLDGIAWEKAGIVKDGVPVVSSPQTAEAMRVIESRCREKRARLHVVGRDITIEHAEPIANEPPYGIRFSLVSRKRRYDDLTLPMLGLHQATNAATAVLALEAMEERTGLLLDEHVVRRAFATLRIPGRIEVVPGSPLTIIDAAHNVASAAALRAVLERHFADRRIILVLGISRDKDLTGIVRELAPLAAGVLLTMSDSPRAVHPTQLLWRVRRVTDVEAVAMDDAFQALAKARAWAGPDDLIVITGSFFLAGMLRPAVLSDRT